MGRERAASLGAVREMELRHALVFVPFRQNAATLQVVDQLFKCKLRQFGLGHLYGRQWRDRKVRESDVIEAHNGKICWG
jgi:hypothetical protein